MRAEIGEGLDLERQEMPLRIEREFRTCAMIARLVVGHETFAAARDPLDRTPQPARQPGDDGFLRIMLALVAEAAADIRRDHADAALRDAELFGHHPADVMGHLRRDMERELFAPDLRRRHHRARLERGADQTIVDELEARDMRRDLHRLAHRRLVPARPAEADVGRGTVMQ